MEQSLRIKILEAIRGRDVPAILQIMFESRKPTLKDGFHHETDL
jgi:ligand-binding SRPBCC domain-containing protein